MANLLVQKFPVLQKSDGNFADSVGYKVTATLEVDNLRITHTLTGESYISQWVKSGVAVFSVRLYYSDSSQRYYNDDYTVADNDSDSKIVATQVIPLKFSYAPAVKPSIILRKKQKVTVSASSGLSDFWEMGEVFTIPAYARIAISPDLEFTSGHVTSLIEYVLADKERVGDNEMKVYVDLYAKEGERPIKLRCGKNVYDQIGKSVTTNDALGHAIVTQALCAAYAYMHNINSGEDKNDGEAHQPQGVLGAHYKHMREKGLDWNDTDNFEPSLAATKMWPYHLGNLPFRETDD